MRVTATVTGANSLGSYEFELLDTLGNLILEEALNSADNFMGELDVAGLASNYYVIGLIADNPLDPEIDITFNRPVAGVPESSTLALFGAGLLFMIGLSWMRRRAQSAQLSPP